MFIFICVYLITWYQGLNPLQINEKDDQANEKDENDKKDENKETVKENDDK